MNPDIKAGLGLTIIIAAVLFYIFAARQGDSIWLTAGTLLIFHAGIFMVLNWLRRKLRIRSQNRKQPPSVTG